MASTPPPFSKQRRKDLQEFVKRGNPSDTPADKTPAGLRKKPGIPGRRKYTNNAPFARY